MCGSARGSPERACRDPGSGAAADVAKALTAPVHCAEGCRACQAEMDPVKRAVLAIRLNDSSSTTSPRSGRDPQGADRNEEEHPGLAECLEAHTWDLGS